MENQVEKPVSGAMEAKFPNLYMYRKPFPLSGYEIVMVLEGLERSIEDWDKMLKRCGDDEELQYRVLESKLYRAELKARIKRLQEELSPLPF